MSVLARRIAERLQAVVDSADPDEVAALQELADVWRRRYPMDCRTPPILLTAILDVIAPKES